MSRAYFLRECPPHLLIDKYLVSVVQRKTAFEGAFSGPLFHVVMAC